MSAIKLSSIFFTTIRTIYNKDACHLRRHGWIDGWCVTLLVIYRLGWSSAFRVLDAGQFVKRSLVFTGTALAFNKLRYSYYIIMIVCTAHASIYML